MQFFEDKRGNLHSCSKIDSVAPGRKVGEDQKSSAKVFLKNDDFGTEVSDYVVDNLRKTAGGTLPVQGLAHVVTYWHEEDEEPFISKSRVLGWRIDAYGSAEPIVLDAEFDGMSSSSAVLFEDGSLEGSFGEMWANMTEWKEAMKERLVVA